MHFLCSTFWCDGKVGLCRFLLIRSTVFIPKVDIAGGGAELGGVSVEGMGFTVVVLTTDLLATYNSSGGRRDIGRRATTTHARRARGLLTGLGGVPSGNVVLNRRSSAMCNVN